MCSKPTLGIGLWKGISKTRTKLTAASVSELQYFEIGMSPTQEVFPV